MDVAPSDEYLIKVVLDGLDGSGLHWMVFNCNKWYSRVLWYTIVYDGI